jgi:hypothetical protein
VGVSQKNLDVGFSGRYVTVSGGINAKAIRPSLKRLRLVGKTKEILDQTVNQEGKNEI